MNVKALIKHSKCLEKEIEELTKTLNENKAKIQEFFDKKRLKTIEVEAYEKNDVALVATKVERVYIDYITDKLKEKLDKDIYEKIIVKIHTISNMKGLIPLLKKAGIEPGEFKRFINTTVVANKEQIKALYEVGDITKEDLKECYTAKIVKSIQIKEKKGDTN